ncbi:bifunctional 3-(3-hydroxy-phenyl)propionate/3-hydroxycinnamic acid hydroxylase MhpA [Streptomyces malaysiensis]|uniref:bifunctional 3-(3-hydroxy-phenyl)propionate/3-hydroxycinnamic acid hydroxylase MhpA n=1 Tax=Streptomyces malaysiensis TaxID=92644 RepID=UPI00343E5C24
MTTDCDVLVVGWGPVGQLTATLLAQQGWRVTVLERYERPYPFPRAVHFDGETARYLAAAGIGDRLHEVGDPAVDYEFHTADGQVLMRLELSGDPPGSAGWPRSVVFHQPALERVLQERAERLPNLRLLRGLEVTDCVERDDHVEVAAGGRRITASWVVGCDGANSAVRRAIGSTVTGLGFFYDWLLCDLVLKEPREFRPNNLQICDPARPTTVVSGGLEHRRWEFMRLPGESIEELNRPETAWRLLEPHGITPDNATMHRHSVYTFSAQWVDQWRRGRILLAGDAAHLMPPFAGQGMCAGIRDAANLTWKLDLVLRGRGAPALLDSYAVERTGHLRHFIGYAIELGKMVCELDPAAAAVRDTMLLARAADPEAEEPPQLSGVPLTEGLLSGAGPGAGAYMPQGRVTGTAGTGRFDDVAGRGFVFLTDQDPAALLDDADREFLADVGTRLVRVVPAGAPVGEGEVADDDGVYLPFLADSSAVALLVRPDFYVFGSAADRVSAAELVGDLRRGLLSVTPQRSLSGGPV